MVSLPAESLRTLAVIPWEDGLMFESLQMAPPDAILGLTELFRKDPNPNKINVAMGVYCDESGTTPILDCVKQAEARMLAEESSKSYLGMAGLDGLEGLVQDLVFGQRPADGRAVTLQTPGGTGALRVAADFLRQKVGAERIWVSSPTWANHSNIFKAAGLEVDSYSYLQEDRRSRVRRRRPRARLAAGHRPRRVHLRDRRRGAGKLWHEFRHRFPASR